MQGLWVMIGHPGDCVWAFCKGAQALDSVSTGCTAPWTRPRGTGAARPDTMPARHHATPSIRSSPVPAPCRKIPSRCSCSLKTRSSSRPLSWSTSTCAQTTPSRPSAGRTSWAPPAWRRCGTQNGSTSRWLRRRRTWCCSSTPAPAATCPCCRSKPCSATACGRRCWRSSTTRLAKPSACTSTGASGCRARRSWTPIRSGAPWSSPLSHLAKTARAMPTTATPAPKTPPSRWPWPSCASRKKSASARPRRRPRRLSRWRGPWAKAASRPCRG